MSEIGVPESERTFNSKLDFFPVFAVASTFLALLLVPADECNALNAWAFIF